MYEVNLLVRLKVFWHIYIIYQHGKLSSLKENIFYTTHEAKAAMSIIAII
jgi:hypothetical protein